MFWPNRKSSIGLRACSKVPRSLQARWFTLPPIAETPMKMLEPFRQEIASIDKLRGALLAIVADRPGREVEAQYASKTDEELALLAAKRWIAMLEQHRDATAEHVRSLEELHAVTSADLKKIREENDVAREKLIAEIRTLKKELDPDEIKLRIMYAVDEATAAKAGELKSAQDRISELESEVAELKRSKKRLREAMERLARNT